MEKYPFKSIPECICIYKISNTVDNKCYIGSTTNLKKRISQHRYDAENRPNNCPKLYKAIKEFGDDKFDVEVVESFKNIDIIELHNKEAEYVKLYNSIENGYNERLDINGNYISSNNTSAKLSISSKRAWDNGSHKDHAKKLSKFQYNIYDLYTRKLIDEDIIMGDIYKKYNIASSNIHVSIRKKCIRKYGFYDETKTIRTTLKNHIIERIYIGKDNNANDDIDNNKNTNKHKTKKPLFRLSISNELIKI